MIIQVLRALPIIGAILGIGKLYSVWSTDTLEDNRKDKIILTLTGIIEISGLGISTLIMKILYNALAHIFIFCLPPALFIEEIAMLRTTSENISSVNLATDYKLLKNHRLRITKAPNHDQLINCD